MYVYVYVGMYVWIFVCKCEYVRVHLYFKVLWCVILSVFFFVLCIYHGTTSRLNSLGTHEQLPFTSRVAWYVLRVFYCSMCLSWRTAKTIRSRPIFTRIYVRMISNSRWVLVVCFWLSQTLIVHVACSVIHVCKVCSCDCSAVLLQDGKFLLREIA